MANNIIERAALVKSLRAEIASLRNLLDEATAMRIVWGDRANAAEAQVAALVAQVAELEAERAGTCGECANEIVADALRDVRAALDANVELQRTIAALRADVTHLEGVCAGQRWVFEMITAAMAAANGGKERE
jgi:hypothetical protein